MTHRNSKRVRTPLKIASVLALAVLASACGRPGPAAGINEQNDVFVSLVPKSFSTRNAVVPTGDSLADCEKALEVAACETDATTNEISDDFSRVACSNNSKSYVPALLKIATEMPERLRPMFCGVERIFISDRITSTAFASPIIDDGGTYRGGFIGARKSTFLQTPSIHELATWKEQLAFGGSSEFLKLDPKLVQIDYGLKLDVLDRDGLFYVLVHELGHLVDYKNGVNADCANARCRPSNGSFAAMSWKSATQPIVSLAFFLRDSFCYYGCTHPIDPSQMGAIYRSLVKSAFVTTYSGQNVHEDFAEFFAWSIMSREKSAHMTYTIPGEGVFDMAPAFEANPVIRKKLDRAGTYL